MDNSTEYQTLDGKVKENSERSIQTEKKVNVLMECVAWYITYKVAVTSFKILLGL